MALYCLNFAFSRDISYIASICLIPHRRLVGDHKYLSSLYLGDLSADVQEGCTFLDLPYKNDNRSWKNKQTNKHN